MGYNPAKKERPAKHSFKLGLQQDIGTLNAPANNEKPKKFKLCSLVDTSPSITTNKLHFINRNL